VGHGPKIGCAIGVAAPASSFGNDGYPNIRIAVTIRANILKESFIHMDDWT
jgi:hypothetical protein